jgi:hypothetical protein
VTVVITPRVETAANGSAAVVTGAPHVLRAFSVPDGALRFERPVGEIDGFAISDSGRAIAIRTVAGELRVHLDGTWRIHELPAALRAARVFALADDGERIAVLAAGTPGRLELWRLADGAPHAAVEIGDTERGYVQANGTLDLILAWAAAHAGDATPRVLVVATAGGLAIVRAFNSQDDAAVSTAVSGEWAWTVEREGVVGYRADGGRALLPGSLRDRIAFSPGSDHVLLYGPEEESSAGVERVLFRIHSLRTMELVRTERHDVAHFTAATYALSAELDILELRVSADGGLEVRALG